jgi:hypothetical protein
MRVARGRAELAHIINWLAGGGKSGPVHTPAHPLGEIENLLLFFGSEAPIAPAPSRPCCAPMR